MGEVLLTARIFKILRKIFRAIMSWDISCSYQIAKDKSTHACKFTGLSKGEQLLRLESNREFRSQTRLHLRLRYTNA